MDTDFTNVAWESLYEAVDDELFEDEDAKLIYESIKNKFPILNFCDYLKRYIYQKAELDMEYAEIDNSIYQDIIRQAFDDNFCPLSFEPTSEKNSAIIKRWLSGKTVKRRVIFILGFGLSMSPADINNFLVKALREHEINPKDPFEAICYFCLKNGYKFPKYESLMDAYKKVKPWSIEDIDLDDDHTVVLQNNLKSVKNETDLMSYLSKLKADDGKTKMSYTAFEKYKEMYAEASNIIAELYNNEEGAQKQVTAEDITEGDFENILCAAIPKDRNGNLTAAKKSDLNQHFFGKRLSRQRLSELNDENAEINRFDLITLYFFIFSQKIDQYGNVRKRYTEFCDGINQILEQCFMGTLYVPNPYECFILMCILSADPLGTYADVWEMSFEENAN